MSRCEFKVGIFVQRRCQRPATANCTVCGIAVCDIHHTLHQGNVICHNCYAKMENVDQRTAKNRFLDNDHDFFLWYASHRHAYYDAYGEEGVFDATDYEGFDGAWQEEAGDEAGDDDFFGS